jgi:hypothetical protein
MARNARGQVGEQQFVPVLKRCKPESGSEIDASLPFLWIH